MLTSTFTWTDAGVARGEALELGPLRLRSSRLELTAGLKDFSVSLVPLIAPLVVALLAVYFQRKQQQFVQERQAWAAMLPASHTLNFSQYLPLLSATASFRDRLEKFQRDPATTDCEQPLFYLMLSIRIVNNVSTKGGFYLAERQGEEIVGQCWNAFVDELHERFQPYRDLSSVLDEIKVKDSLTTFEKRVADKSMQEKITALKERLEGWAKKEQAASFNMMFLFEVILAFEVNRIYDFWYGQPGDLDIDSCEKRLRPLEEQGLFSDTTQRVRAYMKPFKRRRWRKALREWTALRKAGGQPSQAKGQKTGTG